MPAKAIFFLRTEVSWPPGDRGIGGRHHILTGSHAGPAATWRSSQVLNLEGKRVALSDAIDDDRRRACPAALGKRMPATVERRRSGRLFDGQRAKIFTIPGSRNAFARRIGAGLINARGDAALAELADMPVFAIGSIPKLDRVFRLEIGMTKGVGMKIPGAMDERPAGRNGPDLVRHEAFR